MWPLLTVCAASSSWEFQVLLFLIRMALFFIFLYCVCFMMTICLKGSRGQDRVFIHIFIHWLSQTFIKCQLCTRYQLSYPGFPRKQSLRQMASEGVLHGGVTPGGRSERWEQQSKREGESQPGCIMEVTTAMGDEVTDK